MNSNKRNRKKIVEYVLNDMLYNDDIDEDYNDDDDEYYW